MQSIMDNTMQRLSWPLILLLGSTGSVGCARVTPDAKPEFSDAVVYLLEHFDGEESDLSYVLTELEAQIYTSMDVSANQPNDRALTPGRLTEENLATLSRPDRDPTLAIPVAVAGISTFSPEDHKHIQLLVDHTPVEPYSPNFYVRTFVEGGECWLERECTVMKTKQDLTKENLLMTIEYSFLKDFRWINLNAHIPDSVPRWGYLMRAWNEESFSGENGKNHILQSYSIEMVIPRDGLGFIRDENTVNAEDGAWTEDSSGGGLLQMLSVWAETDLGGLNVSDDLVIATTRNGIDKNFKAAHDWLEDNRP